GGAAAVAPGQQVDDRAGVAVGAGRQDEGVFGEIHGHDLERGAARRQPACGPPNPCASVRPHSRLGAGGRIMDKFTARRRASWQSKAPAWPFLAVAFVIAAAGGLLVSLYASGVLLGDGSSGGRAVVWIKTLSNIVIPA